MKLITGGGGGAVVEVIIEGTTMDPSKRRREEERSETFMVTDTVSNIRPNKPEREENKEIVSDRVE